MEDNTNLLKSIIKWSWIVLGLVSFMQIFFFNVDNNISAVIIVILAWFVTTSFLLDWPTLYKYPLSIFLILGFSVSQFFLPAISTLIEGKPLVYNLELPDQVFMHSFLALVLVTVAHFFYRGIVPESPKKIQQLLIKSGLYRTPSNLQVWIMGLFGLGSMATITFLGGADNSDNAGGFLKLLHGFLPFTYAPYFIAFRKMYASNEDKSLSFGIQILVFSFLLLIVSMAGNSRGAFMYGFTSLGFAYVLGLLLGIVRSKIFTVRNVIIISVLLWLLTGPLVDLGMAMVIVRGQRSEISKSELISLTLETYKDKEAIRLYKILLTSQVNNLSWDETYLDNIFLARFCNLKFNDASLIEATKISKYDNSMNEFSLGRLWAILPTPLLQILGIDIDKEFLNRMSFGDYLHYKAGASPDVLGGRRTGHFAGTGLASFGWWYLLILAVAIIPSFFLFDLFYLRFTNKDNQPTSTSIGALRFSLCGLLSLNTLWIFLTPESVIDVITFLIRGWIQLLILYLIVFHVSNAIQRLIPFSK